MKSFTKLICLFFLVSIFHSCQKTSDLQLQPEPSKEPKQAPANSPDLGVNWNWDGDCSVDNPNNPYDQAGVLHNDYMAYLEANYSSETSLEDLYVAVDHILYQNYGSELIPGFSSQAFATEIINLLEKESDVDPYINGLEIEGIQKEKLIELYNIMYRYETLSLCEVIDAIRAYENQILDNYPASDMDVVLISSSVARYSLAYWDARVGNTSSNARKFWKKFFVGVADAIGAAGGAVAGSATVVGGIAGGLAGGIAASTGFAKVWDIFAE